MQKKCKGKTLWFFAIRNWVTCVGIKEFDTYKTKTLTTCANGEFKPCRIGDSGSVVKCTGFDTADFIYKVGKVPFMIQYLCANLEIQI